MTARLRIMIRAIEIRLNSGEKFEEIIKSYPALSDAEVKEIKDYLKEK